jgi:adenylate cyclase
MIVDRSGGVVPSRGRATYVDAVDAADFEAAGLYDPSAPRAGDRLALLEYLCDRGATLDEMVEANGLGRLVVLAGDLERRGSEERISFREAASRAGLPLDHIRRIWRAAGFPEVPPDEPVLPASDVEVFRAFAVGADLFGEEATLQFTRAAGAAMAAVADAALALFGLTVQPRLDAANATELERAHASELASAAIRDQVPVVLNGLLSGHFEAALRRAQLADAGATSDGTTVRLAIGFLDLVGSTRAMRGLTPAALGAMIAEFESATSAAVARRDGRVVKHIGDEVMFVIPDAGDACELALELIDRFGPSTGTSMLRGGLAYGDLVRGYGDYYGPFVNLAARAVKVAEPGTVLVTDELRAAVGHRPGLRFEPAGERVLRGFDGATTLLAVGRA